IAPRRRRATLGRCLAAAAVVAAIAVPSGVAVQQAQRADRAEEQTTAIAEALSAPDARLVAEDVTGGGRAVAVVAAGSALFTAQALPVPADERVYQLWVVQDGEASSAGVLRPEDGLVTTRVGDLPDGAVLALTVEPAGGSAQPTTTPVVALATR
ncbi:anti-sigma factor, partial [Georgenia daeguensis]|uniref:anti-sigma factor n=1 Tax=Georgenia daeguensis TaxID=908355 RepID=UPI0031EA96EF